MEELQQRYEQRLEECRQLSEVREERRKLLSDVEVLVRAAEQDVHALSGAISLLEYTTQPLNQRHWPRISQLP